MHRFERVVVRRPGFTLVELLVVIAIIGVLVALLLPAVQAAREAARRAECANNLKQMSLAAHNCHDTYKYMPGFGFAWPEKSTTLTSCSTFWAILPFMEQQPLYDKLPTGVFSSAHFNGSGNPVPVNAYTCPSDATGVGSNGIGAGWNLATYNVNCLVFFDLKYPKFAEITDGLSNTVFFVEHLALCRSPLGGNSATDGRVVWPAVNLTTGDPTVYWTGEATTSSFGSTGFPGFAIQYPTSMIPDPGNGGAMAFKTPQAAPLPGINGNCDPLTASGGHPAVVMVGMGDGSVRGVPEVISLTTWNRAIKPNDGGILGSDF